MGCSCLIFACLGLPLQGRPALSFVPDPLSLSLSLYLSISLSLCLSLSLSLTFLPVSQFHCVDVNLLFYAVPLSRPLTSIFIMSLSLLLSFSLFVSWHCLFQLYYFYLTYLICGADTLVWPFLILASIPALNLSSHLA